MTIGDRVIHLSGIGVGDDDLGWESGERCFFSVGSSC